MSKPSVLFFDMFGTVLDWKGTIVSEGEHLIGDQVDWESFADVWAREYGVAMTTLKEWTPLDDVLRKAFYKLANCYPFTHASNAVLKRMSTTWERLRPWPDAHEGLEKLANRSPITLSTLTNANHRMQEEMMRHCNLPFEYLLGSEASQCFKPNPEIYLKAMSMVYVDPPDACLVAAHCFDLNAAAKLGMQTALITRPDEPGSNPDGLDHEATYIVEDLAELAYVIV